MSRISQDKDERKAAPMARGLLDYFPAALAGVAACSLKANEQHNPGEQMHWARDKSNDHADCILRHMIDRDEIDEDGIPHVDKVAWRALAMAQEWHEKHGAAPSRASRFAAKEDLYNGVQEHEKSAAENLEPYRARCGDIVELIEAFDNVEAQYLHCIGTVVDDYADLPDVEFNDGFVLVLGGSRQLRLVERGS